MSLHTERPVRTSRDRQRVETRERVYEASLTVFRRDGFDAARIDDIALIAGVSRGAFYFHFPTKEDVLMVLLTRRQHELVAAVSALPDDAPVSQLMHVVAATIAASWQDEPALLASVGVVALRATATQLPDFRGLHPSEQVLATRFESAIARGELPAALPAGTLADFFLVNLFTASLSWCRNPEIPLDALLAQVVEFFLRGLAVR